VKHFVSKKIKQAQRAGQGIRAPFRRNPRVRATTDACGSATVFQTPRAKERKFIIQRDANFGAQ
jgi:hypothetical protein